MRDPAGKKAADVARREAAAWIARMQGADAERSRLAFERWRAASPLHRRLYDEMQAISRQARQLGGSTVAHQYFARQRTRWIGRSRSLAAAGVAATILAASATVIFMHWERQAVPVASSRPLTTSIGRIDTVRLADGTLVTLDTDSEIVPLFDGTTRLVRMVRGRARFDVASDAGRPFVVEAGNRMILDRGTVFDVALDREGVKVALLRGAVEIRDRQPLSGVRAIARLSPGQSFREQPGEAAPLVSTMTDGGARWPDGVLSYDGVALSQVAVDASRYSTRKLRLADPSLGSLRVTGTFKAMPIDGLAAALAAVLKLHVATASNGDLILQR